MGKVTSWRASSTYGGNHAKVADIRGCDKWHVDRFPVQETKSARVSYGTVKVVKRHGK